MIPDPALARHLEQIGPDDRRPGHPGHGGLRGLPLTPWQGLGVVALWTAGALLLGALVLSFRDA